MKQFYSKPEFNVTNLEQDVILNSGENFVNIGDFVGEPTETLQ